MVLAIIIFIQILNGFTNIVTAINIRKHAKLQAELRKLEHDRLMEQLDGINLKHAQIMDELLNMDMNLHCLQDDVFDVILSKGHAEKPKKTRGKYGPRKRKEIEHKKTPSE
jgi:hypothetical protein